MMKNAWRPYGVRIELSAPGLKELLSGVLKNMELIILNDGLFHLVPVTKQMMADTVLSNDVDCLILRYT